MRLWSIHPEHLDARGLVALWRETLLAKNVLQGKTKGYRHHPQLLRFKESDNPIDSINQYLAAVYLAASKRGYQFNKRKVNWKFKAGKLRVTRGQMEYETKHLFKKLRRRDRNRFLILSKTRIKSHPIFRIVAGEVEPWEIR